MASLQQLIETGEVCQCLRSKELFYQSGEEASDAHGPFWCVHTQSLIGQDGQIADAETCRPGRSCCETT